MRRQIEIVLLGLALLTLSIAPTAPALAQAGAEASAPVERLTLFTAYPSQVVGVGENITLPLQLRAPNAGIVQLAMQEMPENWTATFRGANRIVQSVYVEPAMEATVDLRLEPPPDAASGAYTFTVAATGADATAELAITITIQEKLPPRLAFSVELPTLRGQPTTTFRYSVNLTNEGDEDLNVALAADAPAAFQVTFKLAGQEVVDLPLNANESKQLSVEAEPPADIKAGVYPITLHAQGGEAVASLDLTAEVTGQASLSVTTPDGRLSGEAYAGTQTPFKVIVQNTGSAPVRAVEMNASSPSGWAVDFEPKTIEAIEPGGQTEVTANVTPAQKAVAGDYMLSITARPQDGASKSVDFRITVLTSTLWGVAGVGLIAVAVGVVALAVGRFGRR